MQIVESLLYARIQIQLVFPFFLEGGFGNQVHVLCTIFAIVTFVVFVIKLHIYSVYVRSEF